MRRAPADIALDALRGELARAEHADAAAGRQKTICEQRVARLRDAIRRIGAALAEAPAVAGPRPHEGILQMIASDRPREESVVGLPAVPRRAPGVDLGQAFGGFSEQRPETVRERIQAALRKSGAELGPMEIGGLTNLGTTTVYSVMSVMARDGEIERVSRGRYRALECATA